MKKTTIILSLLGLIILPMSAKASEQNKAIAETTKYYKTIVYQSNSSKLPSASKTLLVGNDSNSETIEVSEDEYNKASVSTSSNMAKAQGTQATVETTYKKMTFTITPINSYYRYKVTMTWKNMPSTRSYDTIAIGFPASVKPKGSPTFSNEYCLSNGTCRTVTSYNQYVGNNGLAATFKLPTGSLTSLKETFYFDIVKNTTATIVTIAGAGDYAHATRTVSLTNAKKYSVGLGGLVYQQASIGYYDSIQEAYTEMSVNW